MLPAATAEFLLHDAAAMSALLEHLPRLFEHRPDYRAPQLHEFLEKARLVVAAFLFPRHIAAAAGVIVVEKLGKRGLKGSGHAALSSHSRPSREEPA